MTTRKSNDDLITGGQIVTTDCASAIDDYVDSQISALKKVRRARDLVFVNKSQNQKRRKTVLS